MESSCALETSHLTVLTTLGCGWVTNGQAAVQILLGFGVIIVSYVGIKLPWIPDENPLILGRSSTARFWARVMGARTSRVACRIGLLAGLIAIVHGTVSLL